MMDATRLFKAFYSKHKYACGDSCRFYTKDNTKIQLDYWTARRMQDRILNHIYETGWRWPAKSGFKILNKEIAKYGHIACSSERLSDKDRFSIAKIIESNSSNQPERLSEKTFKDNE